MLVQCDLTLLASSDWLVRVTMWLNSARCSVWLWAKLSQEKFSSRNFGTRTEKEKLHGVPYCVWTARCHSPGGSGGAEVACLWREKDESRCQSEKRVPEVLECQFYLSLGPPSYAWILRNFPIFLCYIPHFSRTDSRWLSVIYNQESQIIQNDNVSESMTPSPHSEVWIPVSGGVPAGFREERDS